MRKITAIPTLKREDAGYLPPIFLQENVQLHNPEWFRRVFKLIEGCGESAFKLIASHLKQYTSHHEALMFILASRSKLPQDIRAGYLTATPYDLERFMTATPAVMDGMDYRLFPLLRQLGGQLSVDFYIAVAGKFLLRTTANDWQTLCALLPKHSQNLLLQEIQRRHLPACTATVMPLLHCPHILTQAFPLLTSGQQHALFQAIKHTIFQRPFSKQTQPENVILLLAPFAQSSNNKLTEIKKWLKKDNYSSLLCFASGCSQSYPPVSETLQKEYLMFLEAAQNPDFFSQVLWAAATSKLVKANVYYTAQKKSVSIGIPDSALVTCLSSRNSLFNRWSGSAVDTIREELLKKLFLSADPFLCASLMAPVIRHFFSADMLVASLSAFAPVSPETRVSSLMLLAAVFPDRMKKEFTRFYPVLKTFLNHPKTILLSPSQSLFEKNELAEPVRHHLRIHRFIARLCDISPDQVLGFLHFLSSESTGDFHQFSHIYKPCFLNLLDVSDHEFRFLLNSNTHHFFSTLYRNLISKKSLFEYAFLCMLFSGQSLRGQHHFFDMVKMERNDFFSGAYQFLVLKYNCAAYIQRLVLPLFPIRLHQDFYAEIKLTVPPVEDVKPAFSIIRSVAKKTGAISSPTFTLLLDVMEYRLPYAGIPQKEPGKSRWYDFLSHSVFHIVMTLDQAAASGPSSGTRAKEDLEAFVGSLQIASDDCIIATKDVLTAWYREVCMTKTEQKEFMEKENHSALGKLTQRIYAFWKDRFDLFINHVISDTPSLQFALNEFMTHQIPAENFQPQHLKPLFYQIIFGAAPDGLDEDLFMSPVFYYALNQTLPDSLQTTLNTLEKDRNVILQAKEDLTTYLTDLISQLTSYLEIQVCYLKDGENSTVFLRNRFDRFQDDCILAIQLEETPFILSLFSPACPYLSAFNRSHLPYCLTRLAEFLRVAFETLLPYYTVKNADAATAVLIRETGFETTVSRMAKAFTKAEFQTKEAILKSKSDSVMFHIRQLQTQSQKAISILKHAFEPLLFSQLLFSLHKEFGDIINGISRNSPLGSFSSLSELLQAAMGIYTFGSLTEENKDGLYDIRLEILFQMLERLGLIPPSSARSSL